ncbi:PREDICTED: hyoscyamine 6-dioxygenase-like isoform X2 [Fragaria vesca subsp. vesca]|uniref:hyoscyamine 6-dioxygenase-like isoform X2 n=1 Tax=Fragaria vesca subsp. vesca TaxID=101020 RepID=UPI0002C2E4D0|nr:PREDICTED: hyoscyamine 6-dioxygenase-like isoform X2 [Fragaria vesca subsp. vesca]
MEKLISHRSNLQSVPQLYILPPETRPGNTQVLIFETIPVIDFLQLGTDRAELIKQVTRAAQEFGFFQLINHGVPDTLLDKVLNVANEFFELPGEDKESVYSENPMQSCRLYTSIDYMRERVHYWRDVLRHPCHPLEEHIQFWPQKPPQYRDVVGSYSVEVRKLGLCLLDLISEGLGLESGFFVGELSQVQIMATNHYPLCPDPSLTLGLPKHSDVNLITLLIQGEVSGLQVLKDEQWLTVQPVPNAFVVNIGHILQIISNGKLCSAEHRVVTNEKSSRTTVASYINPSFNCQIEPAKALLAEDSSAPLYRAFAYKDFLRTYVTDTHQGVPPLERYAL